MGWKYFLTASFFETGAMAAPQKLQNPTDLGQAGPISTQWSHTLAGFPIGALLSVTMATLH